MNSSINMPFTKPRLCIVTALPSETRAILDAYKLVQCASRHLRLWQSKDEDLMLLETGMGKLKAAAATAAALQANPDIKQILNIGIAGGDYPYGQTLVAHQIRDRATAATWYPHLPKAQSFASVPSAVVESLDKPDTSYQSGTLFDMEAAAVISAASAYLSTSQVHCVKVVSDNPDHAIENIDKSSVTQLLVKALPLLQPIISTLQLSSCAALHEHQTTIARLVDVASELTHHSVNDRQLIHDLLVRYVNVANAFPQLPDQTANASQLRKHMQQQISNLPFAYSNT